MDPKKHLRLRATHFDLLRGLVLGESSAHSSASVIERISSLSAEESDPKAVLGKLSEFGIVVRVDDEGDEWEVPPEIQSDVRWLWGRQRARSAGALAGLIDDLEYRVAEFDRAIVDYSAEIALEVIHKLREIIADIANFCSVNRAAIVSQIMQLKANQGSKSFAQRYRIVSDLHDRYIEPTKEILDHGPFVTVIDDLAVALRKGREVFEADPSIPEQLVRLDLRIKALSRQSREDFLVSAREVLPLYAQYRRDTLLAANAAACLDVYHRHGPAAFDFQGAIPVPSLRIEGLFSVSEVEAFLERIGQRAKARKSKLCLRDIVVPKETTISEQEVRHRLAAAAPVRNVLGWLFAEYPDLHEDDVLRAFSEILLDATIEKNLYVGAETTFIVGAISYRHTSVEVIRVVE